MQDLERLYEIGKLGTDQEQSFTELRKNASLCQAEIGELDTLKKQAMPDLVIVFEEEEIVLNEAGEPITINSLNTQNYEIDSGGSSEAGGGYRRNEILLKLQGIQGDLNWAVPGGINSAQGKKVQAMIKATRSKARVMSI